LIVSRLPVAIVVLSATIVMLIGAGCGGGPEQDKTRVRVWHQKLAGERLLLDEAVAEFNASQDDIWVETLYKENEELRNLFVTAAVGGQGPELLYGPADNLGLLTLTKTIRPLEDVFEDQFFDQFEDVGRVRLGDSTWLVADQIGNHLTFVYNKALLPEVPETFDEFIELGSQLTRDTDGDGRIDQYALTWNYTEPFFFIPFLTGFGGWVYDEEGNPSLDTEATAKAIQFILDLRDRHGIIPKEGDYDIANLLFMDGRAAAIINGPWSWSGYRKAGIDFGLARIPRMNETGLWSSPMISAKGYAVNVNVKDDKLPAVRKVVEFLTSAEMQIQMASELATTPVNKVALADSSIKTNEMLQSSTRQIEVGTPMPLEPSLRQIWDGARGPYQLVMNGSVTAEQGAKMMQEQAEKLIADTFL
jgi:maltose-binding protein MalE